MDVGDPSNFVRVLALFNSEFEPLKKMMSSESISDEETGDALASIYRLYRYQADPHGAVGWLALNRWLENHPDRIRHFSGNCTSGKIPRNGGKIQRAFRDIPESVSDLFEKKKSSVKMAADYQLFRKELLRKR